MLLVTLFIGLGVCIESACSSMRREFQMTKTRSKPQTPNPLNKHRQGSPTFGPQANGNVYNELSRLSYNYDVDPWLKRSGYDEGVKSLDEDKWQKKSLVYNSQQGINR